MISVFAEPFGAWLNGQTQATKKTACAGFLGCFWTLVVV
ncbi:hypothetical protein CEV34_0794 [Brucella pseudogrignonensis]|uniref:Uncharacterized protein n=1 Tax=Brucella pseudogrignonensis TaxID=419475 RepID=A0A256GPY5_9HYPH|nr:hypothetical protein CEV34_0794 [Brucella pseudogrignonensis]